MHNVAFDLLATCPLAIEVLLLFCFSLGVKRTNESSNIRLIFQRPNERTLEIRIRTQLFRPVRTVYAGTPCMRTFCTCMRTFLYIVINSIVPIRDLRCVTRPRTCSSVLYCSTTSTRCTHDDLRLTPGKLQQL